MSNIYLDLTGRFNRGRLRAIISSGQAVVLHRLAIMSKDGDWILRDGAKTMTHVLRVLAGTWRPLSLPKDLLRAGVFRDGALNFWRSLCRGRTPQINLDPGPESRV